MKTIITILFSLLVYCSSSAQNAKEISLQFDAYEAAVEPIINATLEDAYIDNVNVKIINNYNAVFTDEIKSAVLSIDNPELLERAQNLTFSYLLDVKDHKALKFARDIFERQGLSSTVHSEYDIRSFHSLMLLQNDTNNAARFAKRYMSEDYYKLSKSLGRTTSKPWQAALLVPRPLTQALDYQHFDLSSYTGVVGVVHPQCHFFHDFLRDIPQDKSLRNAIIKNTVWISNSWLAYDNPAFVEWNRTVPDIQIHLAKDIEEWPQINYWGSPTFYFFRNGVLKKKIVGWHKNSKDEKFDLISEGLNLISDKTVHSKN